MKITTKDSFIEKYYTSLNKSLKGALSDPIYVNDNGLHIIRIYSGLGSFGVLNLHYEGSISKMENDTTPAEAILILYVENKVCLFQNSTSILSSSFDDENNNWREWSFHYDDFEEYNLPQKSSTKRWVNTLELLNDKETFLKHFFECDWEEFDSSWYAGITLDAIIRLKATFCADGKLVIQVLKNDFAVSFGIAGTNALMYSLDNAGQLVFEEWLMI